MAFKKNLREKTWIYVCKHCPSVKQNYFLSRECVCKPFKVEAMTGWQCLQLLFLVTLGKQSTKFLIKSIQMSLFK